MGLNDDGRLIYDDERSERYSDRCPHCTHTRAQHLPPHVAVATIYGAASCRSDGCTCQWGVGFPAPLPAASPLIQPPGFTVGVGN